jgi:hypothetical protein
MPVVTLGNPPLCTAAGLLTEEFGATDLITSIRTVIDPVAIERDVNEFTVGACEGGAAYFVGFIGTVGEAVANVVLIGKGPVPAVKEGIFAVGFVLASIAVVKAVTFPITRDIVAVVADKIVAGKSLNAALGAKNDAAGRVFLGVITYASFQPAAGRLPRTPNEALFLVVEVNAIKGCGQSTLRKNPAALQFCDVASEVVAATTATTVAAAGGDRHSQQYGCNILCHYSPLWVVLGRYHGERYSRTIPVVGQIK